MVAPAALTTLSQCAAWSTSLGQHGGHLGLSLVSRCRSAALPRMPAAEPRAGLSGGGPASAAVRACMTPLLPARLTSAWCGGCCCRSGMQQVWAGHSPMRGMLGHASKEESRGAFFLFSKRP